MFNKKRELFFYKTISTSECDHQKSRRNSSGFVGNLSEKTTFSEILLVPAGNFPDYSEDFRISVKKAY